MNNQPAWLPEPEVSKIPWPTELTFLENYCWKRRKPTSHSHPFNQINLCFKHVTNSLYELRIPYYKVANRIDFLKN